MQIQTPDKALSVVQGFAFALVANPTGECGHPFKCVENRTWPIPASLKLPTWIAIHASRAVHSLAVCGTILLAACPESEPILYDPNVTDELTCIHLGAIIGVVEVVGQVENYTHAARGDRDRLMAACKALGVQSSTPGNAAIFAFTAGPVCWLVRNALEFTRPIPSPGKLNLWQLSPQQRGAVSEQIRVSLMRQGRPPLQPHVWVHPQSDLAKSRKRARV